MKWLFSKPYKWEIIRICKLLVATLKKQFATGWNDPLPRIACLGFDFMVEALNKNIWLLEVNHSPVIYYFIPSLLGAGAPTVCL